MRLGHTWDWFPLFRSKTLLLKIKDWLIRKLYNVLLNKTGFLFGLCDSKLTGSKANSLTANLGTLANAGNLKTREIHPNLHVTRVKDGCYGLKWLGHIPQGFMCWKCVSQHTSVEVDLVESTWVTEAWSLAVINVGPSLLLSAFLFCQRLNVLKCT